VAKEKAPAFQFYPRDFVGDLDVAASRLDEIGCYTLLLCYAWLKNGLPDDMRKLARACRVSDAKFAKLWAVVGEKFPRAEDGRLRNRRQEEERAKQADHRTKGQDAAAARWHPDGIAKPMPGQCSTDAPASVGQCQTDALHLQSASASSSASPEVHTQDRPTPVATGPHRNHAFCWIVCVPAFLHDEFRRKLNGDDQAKDDGIVRRFYLSVAENWPEGKRIGDTDVVFWRARWEEAVGSTVERKGYRPAVFR
jgi:uncharacterized protein YdaU (DUF1376 family)